MNSKRWYYLVSIWMLFCCLTNALAQEISSNETTGDSKGFPAQVSIVYPLGTHGRQSANYIYNFSLNLFTGKIGGVNGLEISGLYGRVEGDMNGVQIAGLANAAGNMVNGIQIAGLGNASGNVKGIQISGLGNATDHVAGIQITGLGNVTDNMKGIQVAGLGNITNKMTGLQISGIGNVTDDAKGLQIGGLANVCDGFRGLQVGGIANIADNVSGLQVGGLFNISANLAGLKIAGISNLSDKVSGVNISGAYNRTHTLRGVQFSIVSITDTIEKGASIAIVNIVKRGFYNEWELSFSDYANVALSYKMGTQKFYTIYTAGANFLEDKLWIAGIGFGNRTAISNRFDFQPELVFYNYFPSDFKNIQYTSATHLKLGFVYNINRKLGLSLAPSVYVMNADKGSKPGSDYYKTSPIGALYTNKSDNSLLTIGVGVTLGLSLR